MAQLRQKHWGAAPSLGLGEWPGKEKTCQGGYLGNLDVQVTPRPLFQKSKAFPQNLTLPLTSVTDTVSSFSAFKLSPTTRHKSESCDGEAGEIVP